MTGRIPYGAQWIDDSDVEALAAAARDDFLTQGPRIEAFEAALAEAVGAPYAVAVSSGTAALHLAALAAGVAPGDACITSPMTFVASANAGVYCGGAPRFADVDRVTRNLAPARVAEAIAALPVAGAEGLRPKLLVAVHYAGLPAEVVELARIARASGMILVEDACHALGASYRDAHGSWHTVGACAHSDMACFSFHPVKHVTTAEGGAITTRSEALYRRLRALRSHGITRAQDELVEAIENQGPWYYEMQALGFNYRITDLQCALGRSQLRRLPAFLERRRAIAARYRAAFAELDGVVLPVEPDGYRSAWHLYPLWFDEARLGRSRRAIFEELQALGLAPQVHYIPVHLQPYYRRTFGTRDGQFPEAERFYAGAVSIPMYPKMDDRDVERVIEAVRTVARREGTSRAG